MIKFCTNESFADLVFSDSSEVSRAKVTVETPHGSVKMRAVSQVPVIGPEDDLAGILLQVQDLTLICLFCFIRAVACQANGFCNNVI